MKRKQSQRRHFSVPQGSAFYARLEIILARNQNQLCRAEKWEWFWFYFDESESVGGAICVKSVAVLKDETEGAFKSTRV